MPDSISKKSKHTITDTMRRLNFTIDLNPAIELKIKLLSRIDFDPNGHSCFYEYELMIY